MPLGQLWKGDLHYSGTWVERNFQEAADLFRKAASRDFRTLLIIGDHADEASSRAAYRLGYMHLHGQGVEKDKAKALEWFVQAGAHREARKALKAVQPLQWTDRWVRLMPPGRMLVSRVTCHERKGYGILPSWIPGSLMSRLREAEV